MSRILDDRARAPDAFGCSRRRVAGVDMISLAGELDLMAAPALRRRLTRAAESSTADLMVLDLSQVQFIDAQCAGVVVAAWEVARRRGARLRIDGLHGLPQLVFDVLGLTPMLAGREETHDGGRNPGD